MTIIMAASAPMKPATEPTLRSIWPETITSSMPSAITMMKLFCCTRLREVHRLEQRAVGGELEEHHDGDQRQHQAVFAQIGRPAPRRRSAAPAATSSATPVCGAGAVSVLMMLFLLPERWRA